MTTNPPIATEAIEAGAVGCLLHMTLLQAREALTQLHIGTDLTTPRTRATAAAIARVVDAGVQPSPIAVLGELQRAGDIPSWSTDSSAGVWLLDIYGEAPPSSQFAWLVGHLRDGALRRRVAQLSIRLGQAAGTAAIADLMELLDREVSAVRSIAPVNEQPVA